MVAAGVRVQAVGRSGQLARVLHGVGAFALSLFGEFVGFSEDVSSETSTNKS